MFCTEVDIKKIGFHSKLLKSEVSILNALKTLFGSKPIELCFFLPPVFLKQGDVFELIARHYSYELFVNNSSAKKIPALIVSEAAINDFMCHFSAAFPRCSNLLSIF